MTMITPSSELTLTKGTSPAGLNEFALDGRCVQGPGTYSPQYG